MNQDFLTQKANGFSAIVQARMGAKRLPGKVLLKIGEKPILEHVICRIKQCHPQQIILAIPDNFDDDPLAAWAELSNIRFVRGSEDDVLARFNKAVLLTDSDILIRVTADNPFVDPEIATRTISELQKQNADFAVMENTPLGTTVEAFTRPAFDRILKLAKTKDEHEHITLAVWNNPDKFRILQIQPSPHHVCEGLRLTIDTKKDLELARLIHRALAGDIRTVTLRDIVQYTRHNPLVTRVNGDVEQHMGEWLKEKKASQKTLRT
jgi:spore coat polysaccharide biosynthesis protein SpsF (cytidylyltransferase family)